MKTVLVELRNNNNALRLLKDLELANIIRVLNTDEKKKNKKLSASLRRAISKDRAKEIYEHLKKMRNEWKERNI